MRVVRFVLFVLAFVSATLAQGVPLPTGPQLQWQRHEIMALIHFNMATFVENGDPACNPTNWNVGINSSNPAVFNPVQLNVSNWIESFNALGAKHGVLTAKHGCGFCIWDTHALLPTGEEYQYAVMRNGGINVDVVAEFSSAMEAAGLGHGFYYSTGNNFYLNRINFAPAGNLLPGQANVTDDEYNEIVLQQLTELWTQYGNLTEIWFDHGYSTSLQPYIEKLLSEYQPNAVGFGGYGLMPSPVRWCGTESGYPAYPMWSTGCDTNSGDPTSTQWCPSGVDTTLQDYDTWFYVPGTPIRALSDLIGVYHSSVGSNGLLELDFAIDRDGLVDPVHASMYADFGSWIRACYGQAVASTSGNGSSFVIDVPSSASQIDRIVIQEDQSYGQRVRNYTVDYLPTGSSSWVVNWLNGTSVGNKRIQVAGSAVDASQVRLNIPQSIAEPVILFFGAFAPCPTS